eukprot:IDg3885t1
MASMCSHALRSQELELHNRAHSTSKRQIPDARYHSSDVSPVGYCASNLPDFGIEVLTVRRSVFRPERRIPTTVLADLVASKSVSENTLASLPTTGTMSMPSVRTTTAYSYRR